MRDILLAMRIYQILQASFWGIILIMNETSCVLLCLGMWPNVRFANKKFSYLSPVSLLQPLAILTQI